ncbi:MAG: hypothetical protein WA004_05550 [Saprospiraceae bacterium]
MKRISLLAIILTAVGAIAYFMLQDKKQTTENEMDYGNSSSKFRYLQDKDISPYAMFGDSSVVLLTDAERYGKQFIEIFNTDKLSETYKIEFDQKAAKIRFYNKKEELIKEELLDPEMIARFLSVDPRADKYYGWSPYNYVLGNPIRNTDPQGDTVRIGGANGNFDWTPGATYDGNDDFISQTVTALNYLTSNNVGGVTFPNDQNQSVQGNVITDFVGDGRYSSTLLTIAQTDGDHVTYADPQYNSEPMILFNPSQGLEFGANGDQQAGSISPSVALAHEFGHAWLWETAPTKYNNMYKFNDPKYGNQMTEELVMKYVERPAARSLNQGVRLYYSPVTPFQAQNVNSNKRRN